MLIWERARSFIRRFCLPAWFPVVIFCWLLSFFINSLICVLMDIISSGELGSRVSHQDWRYAWPGFLLKQGGTCLFFFNITFDMLGVSLKPHFGKKKSTLCYAYPFNLETRPFIFQILCTCPLHMADPLRQVHQTILFYFCVEFTWIRETSFSNKNINIFF